MLILWLQLLGVLAFGAGGALAGRRQQLDLVGCLFSGLLTALGGGTLRDLMLGRTPVFWLRNEHYLFAALGGVVAGLALFGRRRFPGRLVAPLDAIGLGMFAIAGAEIALGYHTGPVPAILLGVFTALFGGVLRDVACGRLPTLFQPGPLNASAAAFGCALFLALGAGGAPRPLAAITGAVVIIALRLWALKRNIRLP